MKLLHVIFTITLSFTLSSLVLCQGFNNRYDLFDEGEYWTRACIYDETGISVLGEWIFYDSGDQILFTKISDSGELEYDQRFLIENRSHRVGWQSSLSPYLGGYVSGGSSSSFELTEDSILFGPLEPEIVRFNSVGDTLWVRHYEFEDQNNFLSMTIPAIDSSGIIGVGQANGSTLGSSNGLIIKVDENSNLIWSKEFGNESLWESFARISPLNNSTYLCGGGVDIGNFDDRGVFYKLDLEGEVISVHSNYEINSLPVYSLEEFCVKSENEVFAVLPTLIDPSDGAFSDKRSHIGMLNEQLQIDWSIDLTEEFNDSFRVHNITLDDNEDLVFLGYTTVTVSDAISEAVVGKINSEGNLLWSRHYIFSPNGLHIPFGIDTYENQIAVSGINLLVWGDEPVTEIGEQDCWVIKLDEHGCLIPGCETKIQEEVASNQIRIFPNPSQDRIFIELENIAQVDKLIIKSLTGEIIDSLALNRNADTVIYSMMDLTSGLYIIEVYSKEKLIDSKKVVKY